MEINEIYRDDPDNIYNCDSRGWTNLHYAACIGHLQQIKKLLDLGANVNAETTIKNTPLHFAIMFNPKILEIAKILIRYGANVHVTNASNKTPLEFIYDKDARKQMEDFILQFNNDYKVAINE